MLTRQGELADVERTPENLEADKVIECQDNELQWFTEKIQKEDELIEADAAAQEARLLGLGYWDWLVEQTEQSIEEYEVLREENRVDLDGTNLELYPRLPL